MLMINTPLKPLLIAQIRLFAAVLAVFFSGNSALAQEGVLSPGIRVAIRLSEDGRVSQVVVDKGIDKGSMVHLEATHGVSLSIFR